MRIVLLVVAINALLLSCGESANSSTVNDSALDSSVTVIGDTASRLLHSQIDKDSFLINIFTARIDSFFTAFAGGELTVSYTLRSYTQRDTLTNVRYMLQPLNGSTIIEYDFDAGDGNPSLTFTVYEARYNSPADVSIAWSEFMRLTGMPNHPQAQADDRFPCISYCNDYSFQTGNKIYWLHADCGYGYSTFFTMRQLLLRSVSQVSVVNSVKCDPGDGSPPIH